MSFEVEPIASRYGSPVVHFGDGASTVDEVGWLFDGGGPREHRNCNGRQHAEGEAGPRDRSGR